MKVAILTIPIHSNFGYIMQLYALQTVVEKLGHEAYTIQIRIEPTGFRQRIAYRIKSAIGKYLLQRYSDPFRKFPTKKQMDYIDVNTWDFLNTHCRLTEYIPSVDRLSDLACDYDVFIVGSDQVWRRRYSIDIPSFFFSFLPDGKKRIAYAASFGISINDYGKRLTDKCRLLLSKFSAVGVRENTAVTLCKDEFSQDAVQVLDPTLLLTKDDYQQLVEKNKVEGIPNKPFVLLYILDNAPEKEYVAEEIAREKGLVLYRIKPSNFGSVGSRHIDDCIYPHISTWLSAFYKADYVITDSFHGTAFSIIYKKQFITIANISRGADRMITLLDSCGLESRLYRDNFVDSDIDYELVSIKLKELKSKSIQFLYSNLHDE